MVKTRIAVLISGGGTNLQALIDAEQRGLIPHGAIALVISSREDAYGLQRAEKAGIQTAVVSRKALGSQKEFEKGIVEELDRHGIEMIVLAGFMQILSEDFTSRYERRIINVHPSLIPAFCGEGCYGLKVHEMALDYGVKVTGATVHYVNEIPDGGEIILQKAVDIREGDTAEILQKRVMAQAEWKILPRAAEIVARRIMMEKEKRVCSIGDILADNSYPGRGIILGKTEKAGFAVCAYFIMGRSENSRNRVFSLKDGELFTEPFDPAKVEDPSLIIYAALRTTGSRLVVTNGDQTDTIIEHLDKNSTFEEALLTRQFEPDSPNYTPRISGIIDFAAGAETEFTYKLSILKCEDEKGEKCSRYTFDYEPEGGVGHFIHTYECDGSPLPSFSGEPRIIAIDDDIEKFTEEVWNSLDEDNRISLFVRYTNPIDGSYEYRLINKNE